MTPNRWVTTFKHVIERENLERLKSDLYKRENGIETLKTKTKSILEKISNPESDNDLSMDTITQFGRRAGNWKQHHIQDALDFDDFDYFE